ncbi:hypothetical protein K461DRAFT_164722 [Myriangium duriaei CBS 260.36]|uniref:2EXR domain-containing protein n=1 Tax=Myriangium duriaei CBS 260.36 TaxID=1168546 RepID=A0A9P4MIG1_9PEZI|nr:hypothetical protein K461DRAFT_164722 [Myriangium duriaei CBS 260.36]
MSSEFHYFPRLPVEIRLQIWREACTTSHEPILFPYEPPLKPLFSGRRSAEGSVTKLKIPSAVPTLHVNREARKETLDWIESQDCSHHSWSAGRLWRHFDPDHDVVYLGDKFWITFLQRTGRVCPIPDDISRIAMDERRFHYGAVEAFVVGLSVVRELYIICDAPEKGGSPENWEIGPSYGGAFVYHDATRKFEFEPDMSGCLDTGIRPLCSGESDGGVTRYEQMKEAADRLERLLSGAEYPGVIPYYGRFELRPVSIVARNAPRQSRGRRLEHWDRDVQLEFKGFKHNRGRGGLHITGGEEDGLVLDHVHLHPSRLHSHWKSSPSMQRIYASQRAGNSNAEY